MIKNDLAFNDPEKRKIYEDFWKHVASALDQKKSETLLNHVIPKKNRTIEYSNNILPFKKCLE